MRAKKLICESKDFFYEKAEIEKYIDTITVSRQTNGFLLII